MSQNQPLVRDNKLTSAGVLLPFASILTGILLIFLVIAFFKGWTFAFYANILFGFYGLTKKIWVSVVLLGVTQTFLMIPFRAIRVLQSHNIEQFQEKVSQKFNGSEQIAKVKTTFKQGNLTFLFYLVDFMVQFTLFISIGRLFLTDFYANKINPQMLLSFIPYPHYPLQGLWFKIPYPVIIESKNLGWVVLLFTWMLVLISHLLIYYVKKMQYKFAVRNEKKMKDDQSINKLFVSKADPSKIVSVMGRSTLFVFVLTYFIVRYFPLAWEIRIFSGDVSIPNNTLNIITAIVTFVLFFWFGLQDLLRKGQLAEDEGIATRIIELTQKEMFKNSFFHSSLIGLGAYFITNLIPSAFELSIFTFELIAMLSPLTLDKFILKAKI